MENNAITHNLLFCTDLILLKVESVYPIKLLICEIRMKATIIFFFKLDGLANILFAYSFLFLSQQLFTGIENYNYNVKINLKQLY
jgi:hypothetical protein